MRVRILSLLCYFLQSPIGWEVVQLVGLQTLDCVNSFRLPCFLHFTLDIMLQC